MRQPSPGSPPHRLTPITLPAAARLPLVLIGAPVTQIPCRHGPSRVHNRCRIYVCRLNPTRHSYRSISCLFEGVHIDGLEPLIFVLCFEGEEVANCIFLPNPLFWLTCGLGD